MVIILFTSRDAIAEECGITNKKTSVLETHSVNEEYRKLRGNTHRWKRKGNYNSIINVIWKVNDDCILKENEFRAKYRQNLWNKVITCETKIVSYLDKVAQSDQIKKEVVNLENQMLQSIASLMENWHLKICIYFNINKSFFMKFRFRAS